MNALYRTTRDSFYPFPQVLNVMVASGKMSTPSIHRGCDVIVRSISSKNNTMT